MVKDIPNVGKKMSLDNVATLNMTYFLFPRQDSFITSAQQLHHATLDPKNGYLLLNAVDAFEHAYAVTHAAIKKEDRKRIDEFLIKVLKEVEDARVDKLTRIKYLALRRKVFTLFRMLYAAQQMVGMGIPKEKRLSAIGKIRAVASR